MRARRSVLEPEGRASRLPRGHASVPRPRRPSAMASRVWQRCVRRPGAAPVSRSLPSTSVHCSNGRVGLRELLRRCKNQESPEKEACRPARGPRQRRPWRGLPTALDAETRLFARRIPFSASGITPLSLGMLSFSGAPFRSFLKSTTPAQARYAQHSK